LTNPDLNAIMLRYPNLTAQGFGISNMWGEDFNSERQDLANADEAFEACVRWLNARKHTELPNRKIGHSYRIKHIIERSYQRATDQSLYIPEGALVAAALSLYIPYMKARGRTSVYLGISSRSID